MTDVRLSPNFWLSELTVSQEAARRGLDNTPSPEVVASLRTLAARLERVRAALGGGPVLISSGYRSPAVNAAVGGAVGSSHTLGCAADFTAPSYGTPLAICRAIDAAGIGFDQLIHEFGRWIHFGIASAGTDRRQTLTICTAAAGYRKGIHDCV